MTLSDCITILNEHNKCKPAIIKLSNGQDVFVDENDFEWISKYKWHIHGGYAAHSKHLGMVDGKQKIKVILMHRLIMGSPEGYEVDHKDRNKLNNTRANLRICTRNQNQMNRDYFSETSQYRGVHWCKKDKAWRAQIRVDGKQKYLGQYKCQIKAAEAYNLAAIKHHGEFAQLNNIDYAIERLKGL
jgi:hypothetical protein